MGPNQTSETLQSGAKSDQRSHSLDNGEYLGTGEVGEYNNSTCFNPDGTIVATAASCQGGSYTALMRASVNGLSHHGFLQRLVEVPDDPDNKMLSFPGRFSCEVQSSVVFSPSGSELALWETSGFGSRVGWRGNVSLYDLDSQRERWVVPFDQALTQSRWTLRNIGSPGGLFTTVKFSRDGALVAVPVENELFELSAGDGSVIRRTHLPFIATSIDLNADGTRWVVGERGLYSVEVAR